jgi:hypothetical protein
MKRCGKCNKALPLEAFNPDQRTVNKVQSYCKACNYTNSREWKNKNKERTKKMDIKALNKLTDENILFVIQHKKKNGCIDCGEKDPVVLECDHIPGRGKSGNISRLVRDASLNRLKSELARCEIRCANCHRRRTTERNPAHWLHRLMAGEQRLKPRLLVSKTSMLLLHHEPIKRGKTPGLQLLLI